jgi:hypothetical protein
MRKLLVFALFLNAALLAVRAFQEYPANAEDSAPVATTNGDVNGDRKLDVSDPIYLLTHIFNGGPAPVAFAEGIRNWAQDINPAAIEVVKGSPTTVSSATIDAAGGKVLVLAWYNFRYDLGAGDAINSLVRRDGVNLGFGRLHVVENQTNQGSLFFLDEPGPGQHTYTLAVEPEVANRYLPEYSAKIILLGL